MNNLKRALAAIVEGAGTTGRAGRANWPSLMTHVVLGYPTLSASMDLVRLMADLGICIVELQIPFSDPLADGPTIMNANEVALKNGVGVCDAMKAVETLSAELDIPLLFMSYYNLLFRYGAGEGLGAFLRDASSAGVEGLIVPDLPLEEEPSEGFVSMSCDRGIFAVPLLSPLSDEERLRSIAALYPRDALNSGFVYCVSDTSTTGVKTELASGLASYVTRVKGVFERPCALGFGISKAEHLESIADFCEIAVVGSATIDLIESCGRDLSSWKPVESFLTSLVSP